MTQLSRVELLLPAGDLNRFRIALLYGADAIYVGTPDMSLRTRSSFSLDELEEGIRLAHHWGKRVYLTLNLFPHNRDIDKLPQYLEVLRRAAPDGIIVADLGLFMALRSALPDIELHISTQANILSWLSVDAWQRLGARRCILAREVSRIELEEIRRRCPTVALEVFVHGAMCMSYSGRCLLSDYLAERSANLGSCAHSCRWKYVVKTSINTSAPSTVAEAFALEEEFRPGEFFPIEEDEHGSYILNSKDLCLMPHLGELLKLNIDSLKVEGRNKSEYYVAVVGRAYRAAIDAYHQEPDAFDPSPYLAELATVAHRGYTAGFYAGRLDRSGQNYISAQSLSSYEYAGFIREALEEYLVLELKSRLLPGVVLEFLLPGCLQCLSLRLYSFIDAESGKICERVTAGEHRGIRIEFSAFDHEEEDFLRQILRPGIVVRKRRSLSTEESRELCRRSEPVREGKTESSVGLESKSGPARAPRIGVDGCCGKGCNGCLPFWHDESFSEARAKLLASRKGRLR